MPVATTDTRNASSRAGSTIAPTMMLASSSTSWRIRLAASSTSYSVRSLPPVIEIRRPRAPFNEVSSNSGLAIAAFGGAQGATFPRRFAGTDHRGPHFAHDRAHVREVEIDEPLLDHKVSNAGDARAKHLIRHRESFGEGRLLVGDAEQVLIRDDNQRIDRLVQFGDAGFSDPHAAPALEVERLGDDADREDTHLASGCRDDGGSACAGATAHAGGEENHV